MTEILSWTKLEKSKALGGAHNDLAVKAIGLIGAGAVVTRDIPDNSVAVGVPASVIKTGDEYFEKLKRDSLHLGHLHGEEKDRALMEHYGYEGGSKRIYY